jgi:hypothetical protein
VIEFYQTLTSTHTTLAAETTATTAVQQKRRHAQDHRLGSNCRRTYRRHRLFRPERALPGYQAAGGFIGSTVLIIIFALILFLIFKRKKWL